jgi:hypothetical protein
MGRDPDKVDPDGGRPRVLSLIMEAQQVNDTHIPNLLTR